MDRIAIMGLGLMGGSLGLALKARGYSGIISAYARRPETRAYALEHGMVDVAHDDPALAVAEADVAVYCTPILTIPGLIAASKAGMKEGMLVTDVGSTKVELTRLISEALQGTGAQFVGSHPVAGSERQGIESARADLYQGAFVVLTPEPGQEESEAMEILRTLWERVGARISVMTALAHDEMLARTSHLPHLVAVILAEAVRRGSDSAATGMLCGTGFRDTSRVAEGSPAVWHDIVRSNAEPVLHELERYRTLVDEWIEALTKKDFDKCGSLLEQGRNSRRDLMAHSPTVRE